MKLARVQYRGETFYAAANRDKLGRVYGDVFGEFHIDWQHGLTLSEVKLLAPVVPQKLIGIGRNYAAHAKELGNDVPERPLMFLVSPGSIIADGEDIVYPEDSQLVHYEGELAVVIKDRVSRIPPAEVRRHILGVTCANDVTARDIQRRDGQMAPAKCYDTFSPLGPFIITDLDYDDLRVQTRVNGKTVQDGRTSRMIFPVDVLVSTISRTMTLFPGDVVSTGTPEGVGELKVGDVVEVEVEGVGVLRNRVVKPR